MRLHRAPGMRSFAELSAAAYRAEIRLHQLTTGVQLRRTQASTVDRLKSSMSSGNYDFVSWLLSINSIFYNLCVTIVVPVSLFLLR